MLNGLDLFTGIGGMSIALRQWVRPIAYCECDAYCQAVLLSRMHYGDLSLAPIWDDVRTLRFADDYAKIDILYGGFPCQDISIAGAGRGLEGERSGLFFEIIRILRETRPRFLFLENVPAITGRGGAEVVREITALGYDCRWCIISAESVGAPHKRERWFLLAHAKGEGREGPGHVERIQARQSEPTISGICDHWKKNEPELAGMADGVPRRMDRTSALGNAVVPAQAKTAFKILMGLAFN